MMNSAACVVERLSPGNIHHLAILFENVFGKKISTDDIRKKYDTSYLGISHLGYIAFQKNKPVGYAGYIPYRVGFGENTIIAVQSVDSMILDEVRGTGIFKLLQDHAIDLLQAEKIPLIFGFANQHSEPVFKKMNWSCDQKMKVFVIRMNNFPYAKWLNKLGLRRKYDQIEQMEVQEYFENPLKRLDGGYVVYDPAFFRYKSFSGAKVILIKGIKVWLKVNNSVQIGNMEHCSNEKFNEILNELRILTKKCGLNEMIFQFSPDTVFAAYLEEHYQSIEGCGIVYKVLSKDLIYQTIHFSNADIDTF